MNNEGGVKIMIKFMKYMKNYIKSIFSVEKLVSNSFGWEVNPLSFDYKVRQRF